MFQAFSPPSPSLCLLSLSWILFWFHLCKWMVLCEYNNIQNQSHSTFIQLPSTLIQKADIKSNTSWKDKHTLPSRTIVSWPLDFSHSSSTLRITSSSIFLMLVLHKLLLRQTCRSCTCFNETNLVFFFPCLFFPLMKVKSIL